MIVGIDPWFHMLIAGLFDWFASRKSLPLPFEPFHLLPRQVSRDIVTSAVPLPSTNAYLEDHANPLLAQSKPIVRTQSMVIKKSYKGAIYLGVSAIVAITSQAANAQTEDYYVQLMAHQGLHPSATVEGYNENTPVILVDLMVDLENTVPGGPKMPAPPIPATVEIVSSGPSGTAMAYPMAPNCINSGSSSPDYGQVFHCWFYFPLTMADRQESNLQLSIGLNFEFERQGITYSSLNWWQNRPWELDLTYHTDAIPLSQAPDPVCTDEAQPLMPTETQGGSFVFLLGEQEVCPQPFFIDPPVAVGYSYSVTGAKFTALTMPSNQTVPDPDGYQITVPGKNWVFFRPQSGQRIQFPSPVSQVLVGDIDAALELDPTDSQAFAMGIELSAPTGLVTITQTPQTIDYNPVVELFPGVLIGDIPLPSGPPVISKPERVQVKKPSIRRPTEQSKTRPQPK